MCFLLFEFACVVVDAMIWMSRGGEVEGLGSLGGGKSSVLNTGLKWCGDSMFVTTIGLPNTQS